ncbi:sigma-70 family RNA polymerase sigma factor [Nocardiopsis halophila]|uniref:sigma-70 family RNA polymerase sigma factor n=1 Tax=Nocardiopsis halophila TaxID=141692 RepID=UPI00034B6117|nr:sigma-70 family RNA polymerase sigma factor [Nocardiopsis halophila]
MRGSAGPGGRAGADGPAFGGRDDELVALLYREFRAPLLRNVRLLTGGDEQWAEDVFQEAALRAWRRAEYLSRERGELWAWMMTVARRIVIDDRRQRGTRPVEVEADRGEDPVVPDASEPTLSALVLAQALPALADHHREVLVLTYLRDLSVGEVAEELGIPPGTVKSRLHYGLRALREAVADQGSDAPDPAAAADLPDRSGAPAGPGGRGEGGPARPSAE